MVRVSAVTEAVPVLVRVRVLLAGAPMAMLPKLRLLGVIWRWDWMPMPVRGAAMGRVDSEVARLRVPVRVPDWVGMKVTWRVQLVAGARVLPGLGQSPVTV
jgi:hypothetical protein